MGDRENLRNPFGDGNMNETPSTPVVTTSWRQGNISPPEGTPFHTASDDRTDLDDDGTNERQMESPPRNYKTSPNYFKKWLVTNKGLIISICVAIGALIVLGIAAIILYIRRHKHKNSKSSESLQTSESQSTTPSPSLQHGENTVTPTLVREEVAVTEKDIDKDSENTNVEEASKITAAYLHKLREKQVQDKNLRTNRMKHSKVDRTPIGVSSPGQYTSLPPRQKPKTSFRRASQEEYMSEDDSKRVEELSLDTEDENDMDAIFDEDDETEFEESDEEEDSESSDDDDEESDDEEEKAE